MWSCHQTDSQTVVLTLLLRQPWLNASTKDTAAGKMGRNAKKHKGLGDKPVTIAKTGQIVWHDLFTLNRVIPIVLQL
jgi:hypothetical protein